MTRSDASVTVPGRIRALGLPDANDLAWKAGASVREWWEGNGNVMQYDLRRKTNGSGSHMFAVYPSDAAAKVDEIIRRVALELGIGNPNQLGMFA